MLLVKCTTFKKAWRKILSDEESGIPTVYNTTDLQRNSGEYLRKFNCFENVNKETV